MSHFVTPSTLDFCRTLILVTLFNASYSHILGPGTQDPGYETQDPGPTTKNSDSGHETFEEGLSLILHIVSKLLARMIFVIWKYSLQIDMNIDINIFK